LKLDGKLKEVARSIEKDTYKQCGNLPAEYETLIERIQETLNLLKPCPYLSRQLRNKRFNVENIKELFDKSLGEMKTLNVMFKKEFQENSA